MAEATYFRNNALNYPVYGLPYTIVLPILDADGDPVTSAAGLDTEISINGDTMADATNEATEIGNGHYYLTLTGTELTCDILCGLVKTSTSGAKNTPFVLYPRKLATVRTGTCQAPDNAADKGYVKLDSSASAIDDFYVGMVVAVVIDSNTEVRVIDDYNGTTKNASVTPDFNVATDNDDTFTVYLVDAEYGALKPTVAARTLDVSAGGEAGVDWANVGSPTTTVGLSGTTVKTATDVETDTADIQNRLPAALVAGYMASDVIAISGDTTAADNLELQFDGTGLTGGTYPSTQAQVASIGSGTGAALNFAADQDNASTAIKSISKVGTQTNTYANTANDNGTYHIITNATNNIDWVYGFSVGGGRVATKAVFVGYLAATAPATGKSITVQAYNFTGTPGWDTVKTITGQAGTTDITVDIALLAAHTGTGAEAGKVYIRFTATSQAGAVLNTDQLYISAQNLGQTIGYADGSIWVDTVSGTAGTTPYVNGTADKPVLTWADALTLAASVGIRSFRFLPQSSITLTASCAGYRFVGDVTIALNGQSIADVLFKDCYTISGTSTGDDWMAINCGIGTATMAHGYAIDCRMKGTFTMIASNDYTFIRCTDAAAGAANAATFVYAANCDGLYRDWRGGIQLNGHAATNSTIIDGAGRVIIDTPASAAGTITVRGFFPLTTGAGTFGGTLTDTETYAGDAGAGLTALPWNAAWDTEVESEATDALVAVNLDHLVGSATGIPALPAGTYLDQAIRDGTATYDRTTDSLQAIRDRGDAAWTTGTGTSTLTAQDVADALKLAPTAGSPAAGSVNADLDTLTTGVTVSSIANDAITAAAIAAGAGAEIADAVWDEAQSGHTSAGTFGKYLDAQVSTVTAPTAAAVADAVWDEATISHTTSGTFGEQVKTDIDAILADTGTDGVVVASIGTGAITAASIAAAAAAKIADIVLRRTTANVEASSDGDTIGGRSLYGAIARLVHKNAISATTLTTYKADDATALTTAALTTSASADPITEVDPAA